ncbi:MAG: histidine biosynthesis protein [Hyphomicrobiales bacterium]|nr:histidine biosynthesis protein [Hyphomicrobiales bacterium]
MRVIPVIDLKGGQVVRAMRGERALYQPLRSPLTAGSAPVAVIDGFLRLAAFRAIYVADLDAIMGQGSHEREISALAQRYPGLEFLVDAGARNGDGLRRWLAVAANIAAVAGSETLAETHCLAELADNPRIVLSLDFRGREFLGPPELWAAPETWPQRVIVMTLASVGSHGGPDWHRLREVAAMGQGRQIIGAGGVRDSHDLAALAETGTAAVLIASALHDQRLTQTDLADYLD